MRWGSELRPEQRWKNWAPCSGGSSPSGQDNKQTPARWSRLIIPTSKVLYSSVAKSTGFTVNPWFTLTVTNIWHCWPHALIPLASPHSTIILPQPFLATFQKSYFLYSLTSTQNGAIPLCARCFDFFFLSQTFCLNDLNYSHGFNCLCNDESDSPTQTLVSPLSSCSWKAFTTENHVNPPTSSLNLGCLKLHS